FASAPRAVGAARLPAAGVAVGGMGCAVAVAVADGVGRAVAVAVGDRVGRAVAVGGGVDAVAVARRLDRPWKPLGDGQPLVAGDELLDVAVHPHAVLPADGAHPLEAGLAEGGV